MFCLASILSPVLGKKNAPASLRTEKPHFPMSKGRKTNGGKFSRLLTTLYIIKGNCLNFQGVKWENGEETIKTRKSTEKTLPDSA
jgi:hypothetical protein